MMGQNESSVIHSLLIDPIAKTRRARAERKRNYVRVIFRIRGKVRGGGRLGERFQLSTCKNQKGNSIGSSA
jgi:hypothetical protein